MTDAGATVGPTIDLYRNSVSPAASDAIGAITLSGKDSAGNKTTYASIEAVIADPVNLTEDGTLLLKAMIAGTLTTLLTLSASGVVFSGGIGATTILLKQSASPTPTVEGDIQWDTDDNVIVVGDGATSKRFFPGVTPGMLWGVTLANNATDALNDIDFSAGFCTDSGNVSQVTCAALTKRLDANWSAGNNNGMRYSGAAISNTTYHLWAVWTAAGVQDYYADPSAVPATVLGHLQAEAGGSSYIYLRRVGSIFRTGGTIKAFTQVGNAIIWTVPASDISANNPGTAAVTATLTVPTGIVVTALATVGITPASSAGTYYVLATALYQSDTTPSASAFTIAMGANAGNSIGGNSEVAINTNTSGQIRYRTSTSTANVTVLINTNGFVDTRGQFA